MVRKLKDASSRPVARQGLVPSDGASDLDAGLSRAAGHYNAGRLDEADAVYASLCQRFPREVTPCFLRGLVAFQRNHHELAVGHLQRAQGLVGEAESRPDVSLWLGKALVPLRRHLESRPLLQAAARGYWDDDAVLFEIVTLLMSGDDFMGAEPIVRRVIELDPMHAGAHSELAIIQVSRNDFASALELATFALQQNPEIPEALRVVAHIHHEVGEVKEAVALYRGAIDSALAGKGKTNLVGVYQSMLGALVYADVTDDELRRAHEGWQELTPMTARPRKPVRPRNGRALRVGYVSPDFRNHAVSFFFEPLLHNHDFGAVVPVLYSNSNEVDDITERIRAVAPEWRDIVNLTDVEVADLIERDDIDILVDLAGHTVGNRMGVFHLRPAPLQINYLGYPSTTGLAEMDYRFTDEDCDPFGETDAVYTEKLVRLPGGFYAWRQPEAYPASTPPPAQTNGFITFGSLNTLAKITDDVIALWSRLLLSVPRSRLILQAGPLTIPWVRTRILRKFAAWGIAADRLDLHGRMSILEHLELYNQMDIALDPFPWGGHTTTCMALFMSVPVITLRGRRMASRMSASALTRMGFDAWIANTEEEYLQLGMAMASDVDRLATIRLAQRTVFATSGLMDGHRLARVVEAAYQAIWDHHAGEGDT